eukprot:TRINITY_DN7852_c0_g1_i9.p1 TRINITY_DN7852_c0_g1~~TRINITY_DN7852_c0_g1_i9.p1  ORF type:complete len:223 (-),score=41.64 TRINITY_DN7852_c0_g1_i9:92-760(-)
MLKQKQKIGKQHEKDFWHNILSQNDCPFEQKIYPAKDYKFFLKNNDNIWNNPSKLSQKSQIEFYKNQEIHQQYVKLGQQSQLQQKEEQVEDRKQRIVSAKIEHQESVHKRQKELAILQQQSCQVIDQNQLKQIEDCQNPFQVKQMTWKSSSRNVIGLNPPNKWNQIKQINHKQAEVLYPKQVVAHEEQCMDMIKEKVIEEQNIESIRKSCLLYTSPSPRDQA